MGDRARDPDPRRQRLHARVPGRAHGTATRRSTRSSRAPRRSSGSSSRARSPGARSVRDRMDDEPGRTRRAIAALRRLDSGERLVALARAGRRRLPGDHEYGDPLSLDGRRAAAGGRARADRARRGAPERAARARAWARCRSGSRCRRRRAAGRATARWRSSSPTSSASPTGCSRRATSARSSCVRAVGEAVEGAVRAHGGRVVKRLGDGLMAVFDDPAAAVRAACEATAAAGELHAPGLRAGVHIGRPRKLGGDYFGVDVNVAARVAARGRRRRGARLRRGPRPARPRADRDPPALALQAQGRAEGAAGVRRRALPGNAPGMRALAAAAAAGRPAGRRRARLPPPTARTPPRRPCPAPSARSRRASTTSPPPAPQTNGHTDASDWAGPARAGHARTRPACPGLQIDGYFPDTSTTNSTHGWNHDAQFVIRLPERLERQARRSRARPGVRKQYASDFVIGDCVLGRGYAYAVDRQGQQRHGRSTGRRGARRRDRRVEPARHRS